MNIVRWEPFREMDVLRRQMDRLVDEALGDGSKGAEVSYVPPVEFRETPVYYLLKTALPGVKGEDIDIQATSEAISITAEHRFIKEDEKEINHRSEFRYGKYVRQLALPGRIDADQVQANFENGVLTLTLPKVTQSRAKKIAVATTSLPLTSNN